MTHIIHLKGKKADIDAFYSKFKSLGRRERLKLVANSNYCVKTTRPTNNYVSKMCITSTGDLLMFCHIEELDLFKWRKSVVDSSSLKVVYAKLDDEQHTCSTNDQSGSVFSGKYVLVEYGYELNSFATIREASKFVKTLFDKSVATFDEIVSTVSVWDEGDHKAFGFYKVDRNMK